MPHFRLQTVLDLRERSKKSSEEAFLLARQAAQKEKQQLDTLEVDLHKKVEFREHKRQEYAQNQANGPTSVASFKLHESHIQSLKEKEARLKDTIEGQKQVLQKANARAETRRDEMLLAGRDFKTIDKIKDKFLVSHKKHVEMREDNARDELSQARYQVPHD
jgi:flagellar export protein FliJ